MRKNIAIAGVTGAVGQEFLNILAERQFPFASIKMLASSRSAGKKIPFMGKEYTVEELTADSFDGVDIALFSAGGARSKEFAPAAVGRCGGGGCSSAFRMDPGAAGRSGDQPEIARHKGIIANPNCSTIIANVPLCSHCTRSILDGWWSARISRQQGRSVGSGNDATSPRGAEGKPVTCKTLKYRWR